MKPGYIGIGAQKCASSWLHRVLEDHPEVCASAEKEIDFFSRYFDRGYQWYESHFDVCGDTSIAGEFSPSYFCDPSVPERVHRYIPDARIILALRDPVQRALSNHRHEVRVGHLSGPDFSFECGLANNPMYVEQGRYATHLRRWLRWFSAEQILVVLQEDIDSDPMKVARAVYDFVGVDADHVPQSASDRVNRSYANRSRVLLAGKDRLYALTRTPSLQWIWGLASRLGLRSMYRSVNQVASGDVIPAVENATLEALTETLAPEVSELEQLLGRSLSAWRH